ncbi:MAG TPA: DUF5818 domain-containing protein [Myxococcota bacterium]|nr:DUF5818 domain-containing protein [Myxococcota bacterium]
MTLTGTLSREFFGGPLWVLRSDDGASYQLNGEVPEKLEGCRVRVRAKKAKGQFGIAMIGEILDLSSIEAE